MADLVKVKRWEWGGKAAQEAFQAFPSEVQEAFEEKLGQRIGELHKVGNRQELVWAEGETFTVWTFLDTDGVLWVTTPPTEAV